MEAQPFSFHKSPKRKRDEYDQDSSAVPTFPQTVPQGPPVTDEPSGNRNPHVAVAGQFEDLDIQAQTPSSLGEITSRDQTPLESSNQTGEERTKTEHEQDSADGHVAPVESGESKDTALREGSCDAEVSSLPAQSSSRQRSKTKKFLHRGKKKRRKSPPLTSEPRDNPLTWHESEITGHNPTDPNDDGYGINGIGFKPTAAVSWDRSQRRKKQVDDWKKRESREARDKRREKRLGGTLEYDTIASPSSKKKVSFVI